MLYIRKILSVIKNIFMMLGGVVLAILFCLGWLVALILAIPIILMILLIMLVASLLLARCEIRLGNFNVQTR